MSTNPPASPNVRVLWGFAIATFDPVSMRSIASDATALIRDLEYITTLSKAPEHDIRRSYVPLVFAFILLEFGKLRARSPELSSDSSDAGQLAGKSDGLPGTRLDLSFLTPSNNLHPC